MSTIYYSKYFIASLEHSVVGKVLNCAWEDSYGSKVVRWTQRHFSSFLHSGRLSKSLNSNLHLKSTDKKIPLKSSHNSLCCYKHVLQNVTLYHRALQGRIAHAEEWSADKTAKQKILASSLQTTG